MQNILYLDCFSGVAGDMTLSALVDAGADEDVLEETLQTLTGDSFEINFTTVHRHGAAGTYLQIEPPNTELPHEYPAIRRQITEASLPEPIRDPSLRALDRLAEVEADYHGCKLEEVHFHELAGFDLLIDLVGTAACLYHLDVEEMYYPDVPVSSGWLNSHHGRLPVPAPAVLGLLKNVNIYDSGLKEEITTPTGAAILTTMGTQVSGFPDMTVSGIGYGAGTKELSDRSNLLRAVLGTTDSATNSADRDVTRQRVCEIRTNLDDTTPEILSHAMQELFDAGALDVFVTSITMKKNRSGHLLTVLCDPADRSTLTDIILRETSTLGVRTQILNRTVLPRNQEEVETEWGTVRMKVSHFDGTTKATPEFEDCRKLAEANNCSLTDVMKAAQAAWTSP